MFDTPDRELDQIEEPVILEQDYDEARQAEIDDAYFITESVATFSLATRIQSVLSAFELDEFDVDEAIEVLKECKTRIEYDDSLALQIRQLTETIVTATDSIRACRNQGNQA